MDITPQHQQPAQSDDDLAKVLAGASNDPNQQSKAEADGLQFEETPAPGSQTAATAPAPGSANVNLPTPEMPAGATTSTEPEPTPPVPQATPVVPTAPTPTETPAVSFPGMPTSSTVGGLDTLKKDALEELRPLIGKLNLPAEEMFDTLLLIIRSTDDQSLLEPAHDAAKSIQDEGKRAQALLDIIKEIDYFSGHGTQPA